MKKILSKIKMFILCNRKVFVEAKTFGIRLVLEFLSGHENAEGELSVKLFKFGDGYFCPITTNVWLISLGIYIEKTEEYE